ncbi:bestrophin family protein [Planctomicrobium sp. SH661]|uniref:bestrophin family protein n=1 Tax=Planctomicrobium sp. SH661 TaxID=3448124 RepID=UPI003F5AE238
MIEYNRYSWWKTTFSWKGTPLSRVAGRVLLFTSYAALVQFAYQAGLSTGLYEKYFGIDPVAHSVLGSLLGFLIVFRMNSSNARYWEGRSSWGQIINASRNLVRLGSEYATEGGDLAGLVTGFAICLRRALQGHRDTEDTEYYLPEPVRRSVAAFGNPPTGVAAAISAWIGRQFRAGTIDAMTVRQMEEQLSKLVDAQGACEKIQKTPLPFAYVVMVKQLILVYLITLPLVLCERCGWWSPLLMIVISLGQFGMEEASVEIEDPFGTDDNCLDMQSYCLTIARDTGQLATRSMRSISEQ